MKWSSFYGTYGYARLHGIILPLSEKATTCVARTFSSPKPWRCISKLYACLNTTQFLVSFMSNFFFPCRPNRDKHLIIKNTEARAHNECNTRPETSYVCTPGKARKAGNMRYRPSPLRRPLEKGKTSAPQTGGIEQIEKKLAQKEVPIVWYGYPILH